MTEGERKEADSPTADPSPLDTLTELLINHIAALNSFTDAVMCLTQAVADLIALNADEDTAQPTYLDGSEVLS